MTVRNLIQLLLLNCDNDLDKKIYIFEKYGGLTQIEEVKKTPYSEEVMIYTEPCGGDYN